MFKEFIELKDKRKIFVHYQKPKGSQPTLVFLNGLSYQTHHWDKLLSCFKNPHWGFLRFDFRGQGQTLKYEVEQRGPIVTPIPIADQVEDLKCILDFFEMKRVEHLIALSYGTGVATAFASRWPERVHEMILMSPFGIRLDQAHSLQRIWAQSMGAWFQLFPLGKPLLNQMTTNYNRFMHQYMHMRFAGEIPDYVKREAAIQLSFGIMDYSAFDVFHLLPERSTHLMIPGRDTLVPIQLYKEIWNKMPARVRGSCLWIEDGTHILPYHSPEYCAQWIEKVIESKNVFSEGNYFSGNTYSMLFDQHQTAPIES